MRIEQYVLARLSLACNLNARRDEAVRMIPLLLWSVFKLKVCDCKGLSIRPRSSNINSPSSPSDRRRSSPTVVFTVPRHGSVGKEDSCFSIITNSEDSCAGVLGGGLMRYCVLSSIATYMVNVWPHFGSRLFSTVLDRSTRVWPTYISTNKCGLSFDRYVE